MHRTTSPDASDGAIEAELVAKGLTAPRVTLADIEAEIAGEHYFTAADGAQGAAYMQQGMFDPNLDDSLRLLTFCVLVLRNGHRIVGVNEGPVSSENFDAEIGRKIARSKAIDKCWPLLGFRLRDRIAAGHFDPNVVGDKAASSDDVMIGTDNGPARMTMQQFQPVSVEQSFPDGVTFIETGEGKFAAVPGTPTAPQEPPHRRRVRAEQQELSERMGKLRTFLATSSTFNQLDVTEAGLLVRQYKAMVEYHNILAQRIALWDQP